MNTLQRASCDRWLPLSSPAVSRLVALELISTSSPHPLPDSLRSVLEKQTSANDSTTLPFRVWVELDLANIEWTDQKQRDQLLRDGALRYLVLRQACYPLIQRLFRISRVEWVEVRKRFNAPAAPRGISAKVPDDIQEQIYTTWLKLGREYSTEMDRWVMMGEAFKTLPLSSIYALIYGGDALKPGQL